MKSLAHRPRETFCVLFLDARNYMLKSELLWEGTVNEVHFYPREVLRKSLEVGASAIIAAHNHPSGNPCPSQQDIVLTKRLDRGCEALDIVLHDHLIVGRSGWFSLRVSGLLQEQDEQLKQPQIGVFPPLSRLSDAGMKRLSTSCPVDLAARQSIRKHSSLVAKTRELSRQRKRRIQYFEGELFGEPAWDILLDLFASAEAGKKVSVTNACMASGAPHSTAMRCISYLVSQGTVVRKRCKSDARTVYLTLSRPARLAMRKYILEEHFHVEQKLGNDVFYGRTDQ